LPKSGKEGCMEVNLVVEAFKFMILGMLVVFTFLYLLVLVMKVEAKVIERYFPDRKLSPVAEESGDEEEERRRVAAIIAAVIEYRKS